MIAIGIIILILGIIFFLGGAAEESPVIIIGFVLILAGICVIEIYNEPSKSEKLYLENQELKRKLNENQSKIDRYKFLKKLEKENKMLKDSLKHKFK